MSLEQLEWLKKLADDEAELDETPTEPRPKEDVAIDLNGFEPWEFQLANGNHVRIIFAKFSEKIRRQDWREGARPSQYYAIKIYSDEETQSRHMAVQSEFRGGKDFSFSAVQKIWDWLAELLQSRRLAEYDTLAEFIDEFAEEMNCATDAGEDVFEHLQKLPQLADPKLFDQDVDDSIYNDQNEPEQREI